MSAVALPWFWLLMARYRKPLGAVIVGASVVLSSVAIYQTTVGSGGGGDPGLANFWVDTNGGTCVRQSPAGAYADATACDTLDEAYQASGTACGDSVKIKAGSYGVNRILERTALSSCSPDVTFSTADGESVSMEEVAFGADAQSADDAPDNVTIQGPMTMLRGVSCSGDCHNIIIDNVDGGTVSLYNFDWASPDPQNGPNTWTIQNSDFGPCDSPEGGPGNACVTSVAGDEGQIELISVKNITFINNTIHDYDTITTSEPHDHFECVRTDSPVNTVFRGNKFWNCEIEAVGTSSWQGTSYIENNWFGGADYHDATARGSSVGADVSITGTVYVRFNSFSTEDRVTYALADGDGTGLVVVGNIIGDSDVQPSGCLPSGAVYKYNVFLTGQSCGDATNVTAGSFSYVNGARSSSMNYHLTGATWAADNRVTCGSAPGGCPSTDIDGESRAATADAGSDERDQ